MSLSFRQAMEISGLIPGEIVADGKWRRCRTNDKKTKKNGAFILHPDGRGYWRNWALDDGINSWRDDSTTHAAPIDPAVAQRQREQERAYRIRAMRSAREFWDRARPLNRPHKYIEDKGLSPLGCAGLRQHDGLLVVPVWHGQWITSVQTIAADGEKRFWPGAPVKAGVYVMDRQRPAVTAICEGLATGLAIFQSVKLARVIVAFDAGNLLPVVQRVKPTGSVVLVADNDHATAARIGKNPGIEKAKNAADLIGCGVMWFEGIEGSDAADALKEWGQGASRRIERAILAGARYVEAPA